MPRRVSYARFAWFDPTASDSPNTAEAGGHPAARLVASPEPRMAAYLTPAQLTVWYDTTRLYQLIRDDGVDATASDLTDTGSAAYQLLAAIITGVSAEIDSALQVGRRYARTDLETMVDDALAVGATAADLKRVTVLYRLVADLTFGALVSRRGFSAASMAELCPRYEDAQRTLAALADGGRVFDMEPPKTAGMPTRVQIGTGISNTVRNSRLFGQFPVYGPGSEWVGGFPIT